MFFNCSAKSIIYFFVYICHFTCRCRAKEQENFPFLLKKPKFAAESELKALVAGKFQKSAVKRCVFMIFLFIHQILLQFLFEPTKYKIKKNDTNSSNVQYTKLQTADPNFLVLLSLTIETNYV